MEIHDKHPSIYHTFRIEVHTDISGHMLDSSANRNLAQSQGFYGEPHKLKPAEWRERFSRLDGDGKCGKFEKKFINMKDIGLFLCSGTLTFVVRVTMKDVEIINNCSQRSHGHQRSPHY
jgi:hypothetical protein